jgi:hypothetical protein
MALTLHGTVSDNTVALDRKTATPLIINGDMQIAQRGTSATALGNGDTGYHTVDRFKFREDGTPTYEFTMSQSTDTPTGEGFSQSLKLDCTTADTSLAGADSLSVRHIVEAQNLQMLKYGTSSADVLTLSFWVKTNKTGTYTLWVYQPDGSRNISKEYTVSSANTWEKKVINIDADTGGTINNDNDIGLTFGWYLGAGADHTSGTLNTTWNSLVLANRVSSSQVNLSDSTDNDWYLTGVQLEVGSFDSNSIANFQFEDVGTSLTRCKRYYQTIGNGTVAGQRHVATGKVRSSTKCDFGLVLPFEMRSSPTISVSDGTGFEVFHGGSTVTNTTSLSYSNSSPQTVSGLFDVSSGLTAGDAAFIRTDSTAGRELQMDSEL